MANSGQIVGKKYKILTEIGHGGMSTVYLALDTTLSKQWAVKEIRHIDDKAERKRIIDGLISEANLIKTFDHPAIPRIVDLIEENNSFFVVMDYVEGGTLTKLLAKQGAQPEKTVVSWGIQLCDVLDYLHRLDPPIVYRDMKPSNVMITPDGVVRIIDFGIACAMPSKSGPLPEGYEARMGTPGYAAPEQYDEYGRCDARTDVYGLGALLYTALTGNKSDDEPYDLPPLRQMLPGASAGLERVLAKALQKDPDNRYQSCAAMAYDLEHANDKDMQLYRSMQIKWRVFCSLCVATVVLVILGLGTMGAGALTASSSYGHKMELARQASDDKIAEQRYVEATSLKPSATAPYEGLIKRYEADGVFDDTESQQLQQAVSDHNDSLRSHDETWSRLSFDIGKLYWYYYTPQGSEDRSPTDTDLQHERMQAAESWMNDASKSDFSDKKLAELYAKIADFETTIVPMINEGSDQGKYAPYFNELTDLMDSMQSGNNDVMRLSSANTVLDAVRAYSRKFRADGIGQQRLNKAIDTAQHLAQQVTPTTDELKQSRDHALESVAPAQQTVAEAFVDITGKESK